MQTQPAGKSYAFLFFIPLTVFVLAYTFRTLWLLALIPVAFVFVGVVSLAIMLWTGKAFDKRWRASIGRKERPLFYWTYIWLAMVIDVVLVLLTYIFLKAL